MEEELEFLAVVEELEFLVVVKELGSVEVWGSSHEEEVGLVPWEVSEVLE